MNMFVNFSIHLDDHTSSALKKVAAKQGRTRNSIIAEAVRRWLAQADRTQWPKELLEWQGDPALPPFESHRSRRSPKPRFP